MKHRAHRASDRAKQSATRRDYYHQLEMKRAADKERSQREIEALEAEAKAESYRKKNEAVANDLFVSDDSDGGKHKSRVKAVGIKSAFYLSDNRGLITTFGQGNSSVPELLFDIDSITVIIDDTKKETSILYGKMEIPSITQKQTLYQFFSSGSIGNSTATKPNGKCPCVRKTLIKNVNF